MVLGAGGTFVARTVDVNAKHLQETLKRAAAAATLDIAVSGTSEGSGAFAERGTLAWDAAKDYCAALALDGGGFHLPTREELLSLLRKGDDPFGGEIDWFWSSSAGVRAHTAWAVGAGAWLNGNPTTTQSRVRCVRTAR